MVLVTSSVTCVCFSKLNHTAVSFISTRISDLIRTITNLLIFPVTLAVQHNFSTQIQSSTMIPSSSVINSGNLFDQLTFNDHYMTAWPMQVSTAEHQEDQACPCGDSLTDGTVTEIHKKETFHSPFLA